MNDDNIRCQADLARVRKFGPCSAFRGELDVRLVRHNDRIPPAKLQRQRRKESRRALHYLFGDSRSTREQNVAVRVVQQCLCDVFAAVDHTEAAAIKVLWEQLL